MILTLNYLALALVPDPVLHDGERELGRAYVGSVDSARAWFAANREAWARSLVGDETSLEMWVYDTHDAPVLYVRVGRDGKEDIVQADAMVGT